DDVREDFIRCRAGSGGSRRQRPAVRRAGAGAAIDRRILRWVLPGGPEQGLVSARRQGDGHNDQGRDLYRDRRSAAQGEGGRRNLGRRRQRIGQRGARRCRGDSGKARLQGHRRLEFRSRHVAGLLRRRRRVLDGPRLEHQDLWRQGAAELGRFLGREEVSGKRSYRKSVAGALEPALMADGVPADKVYEVLSAPGGIERAIKKIKELKPNIAVWWASGAQHAQLMKDGEVDMITGWNGRFDVAAKDGGK